MRSLVKFLASLHFFIITFTSSLLACSKKKKKKHLEDTPKNIFFKLAIEYHVHFIGCFTLSYLYIHFCFFDRRNLRKIMYNLMINYVLFYYLIFKTRFLNKIIFKLLRNLYNFKYFYYYKSKILHI